MIKYFIDLKDLALERISFEGSFEPGDVDLSADNISQAGPLEWSASAQRAGDEVRIVGSLNLTVGVGCSRCLEPAQHQITRSFDLYFMQRDEHMFDEDAEVELTEKDMHTAFFTGTQLAIGEILREQILLALPMKVLCRVDCKGLCPTCGMNLNSGSCHCPIEKFSPHMDSLLELKRQLEKRSS